MHYFQLLAKTKITVTIQVYQDALCNLRNQIIKFRSVEKVLMAGKKIGVKGKKWWGGPSWPFPSA